MKGIILHGGKGTRLRPLTHTEPKQLIPVANKPISQYVLEDLRNADIKDIVIVLGDIAPERVSEYYRDGSSFGVNITYVHQGFPKGIAHAVGICKDLIGDTPFVVYLGDNILKAGIKRFVEEFENNRYDAMILLCKVKNPEMFGVAVFNKEGKLVRVVEKSKTPLSDYAIVGIFFFTAKVFDAIDQLKPSWRGEFEITDAIQKLMDSGCHVEAKIVSGWWKDTGTPEDILDANRLVLEDLKPNIEGIAEEGSLIQGKVSIGKNTVIKKGSVIRGPVIIGEECEIGPNVYIGPYTSIGSRTIIKSGEIENSIIVNDCYIDCNKRIADSLIGAESKIMPIENMLPKGYRFLMGERTCITI